MGAVTILLENSEAGHARQVSDSGKIDPMTPPPSDAIAPE